LSECSSGSAIKSSSPRWPRESKVHAVGLEAYWKGKGVQMSCVTPGERDWATCAFRYPVGSYPRRWLNPMIPVLVFLIFPFPGAIRGDTLDEIKNRGVIVWGGDQEGGGPYIYPSPEDPNKLTGFEVELMDLLAAKLGVRPQFKQAEWDSLPNLLGRKDI